MTQMARNAVDDTSGGLSRCRYVLHDRDAKYCPAFDDLLASEGVKCLRLPPRSPNLNAFAERWGAVRQRRMPIQARPVRRTLAPARLDRVRGQLSFGAQSSGQGQLVTLPFSADVNASPKASTAANASAACFDTTAGPREYLDLMGKG